MTAHFFILATAIMSFSAFAINQECTNIYPKTGPFFIARSNVTHQTNPKQLKIVSYNVGLLENAQGVLSDLMTLESLKNADVILLQEVAIPIGGPDDVLKEYSKVLGMSYVFSPAMTLWNKDYGNAVFSRYPIQKYFKELLPLSSSEECNQRIGLVAQIIVNNQIINVASAHLSVRFPDTVGTETSRSKQLEPLFKLLAETKKKSFIAGDMNVYNPWGEKKLIAVGKTHGFVEVNLANGATFRTRNFKLDRAFGMGLPHKSSGIETEAKGSDHFPIWQIVNL